MRYALSGMVLSALVAATPLLAAPSGNGGAISATYSGNGIVGSETHSQLLTAYRKQRAINALMHEGRELQMADGGTLTAEHHAYLQAKLNSILAGNY